MSEGVVTRSVRDTAYFYAGMEQRFYNKKLPKIVIEQPIQRRLRMAITPIHHWSN